MGEALRKVDYLIDVPEETINKIIFQMTFAKFDKGNWLFKVDEKATMLQIV